MPEYDKVSRASTNGIYLAAQKLDKGQNGAGAPGAAPAGKSAHASTHASTHGSTHASTHASTHSSGR